jgi:hypothetical protein
MTCSRVADFRDNPAGKGHEHSLIALIAEAKRANASHLPSENEACKSALEITYLINTGAPLGLPPQHVIRSGPAST